MRPDRFRRLQEVLDRRQPDLTVLMERVHKSHNFSAVLRSCDAVGVLEAHTVPPEEGLSLHHQTSGSASKWVRVRRHRGSREAISALRERGFQIVAAHPVGEAVDYRAIDFLRPTAIMVGTELDGLSPESVALADRLAMIPMHGMIHSLNVSVATAIFLFEALRQRSDAGMYDSSRLDPAERQRILFEWSYPRIASRYRREGIPYPPLGEDGAILERKPGSP